MRMTTVLACCFSCIAVLGSSAGEPVAVAILDFQNAAKSSEHEGLAVALREWLITDLSNVREMRLVERARIADLVRERDLAESRFIDPSTAAKMGKGVGADAVLVGSFFVRDDQMRLDARLVDVETGQVIQAEKIEGSSTEFFRLEKELASKIVGSFGIKLSAFEQTRLGKVHTRNLAAALAYGRAQRYEEEGELAKAKAEAAKALASDRDFTLVLELVDRISRVLENLDNEKTKESLDHAIDLCWRYESDLLYWPFAPLGDRSIPRFKMQDFLSATRVSRVHGLRYWTERLAPRRAGSALGELSGDFFQVTVNEIGFGGILDYYLILGGSEPCGFWLDVLSSGSEGPHRNGEAHGANSANRASHHLAILYSRFLVAVARDDLQTATEIAENGLKSCGTSGQGEPFQEALLQIQSELKGGKETERLLRTVARRSWPARKKQIVARIAEHQTKLTGDPPASEANQKSYVADAEFPLPEENAHFLYRCIDEEWIKFKGYFHRPECRLCFSLKARPWQSLASGAGVLPALEPGEYAAYADALNAGYAPCPVCRPLLASSNDYSSAVRMSHQCIEDLESISSRLVLSGLLATSTPELFKALDGAWKTCVYAEPLPANVPSQWGRLSLLPGLRMALLRYALVQDGPSLADAVYAVPNHLLDDLTIQAILAAARNKAEGGVPELSRMLRESPFFHRRMYAVAALGSIGTPEALAALRQAESKEPFYFVRHWIEAAELRASEMGDDHTGTR